MLTITILTFIIAIIVIFTGTPNIRLALCTPVLIGLSLYSFVLFQELLGYPTNEELLQEALIIYNVSNQGVDYYWVLLKGDSEPRAYILKLDKEEKKKLQAFKKQGVRTMFMEDKGKLTVTSAEQAIQPKEKQIDAR